MNKKWTNSASKIINKTRSVPTRIFSTKHDAQSRKRLLKDLVHADHFVMMPFEERRGKSLGACAEVMQLVLRKKRCTTPKKKWIAVCNFLPRSLESPEKWWLQLGRYNFLRLGIHNNEDRGHFIPTCAVK